MEHQVGQPVEFEYRGNAAEVRLAGAFTRWVAVYANFVSLRPDCIPPLRNHSNSLDYGMRKVLDEDGNVSGWRKDVQLRPGSYQYHFVVDGNVTLDQNVKTEASNNPKTPDQRESVVLVDAHGRVSENQDVKEAKIDDDDKGKKDEDSSDESDELPDNIIPSQVGSDLLAADADLPEEIHGTDKKQIEELVEKERSERIEADKQIPHEIITSKTEEIEKLVEKERAERIAADAAIPKEIHESDVKAVEALIEQERAEQIAEDAAIPREIHDSDKSKVEELVEKERREQIELDKTIPFVEVTGNKAEIDALVEKERQERIAEDAAIPKEIHESTKKEIELLVEKERAERIEEDKAIPSEIHDTNKKEIEKLVEIERQEQMAADKAIPKEIHTATKADVERLVEQERQEQIAADRKIPHEVPRTSSYELTRLVEQERESLLQSVEKQSEITSMLKALHADLHNVRGTIAAGSPRTEAKSSAESKSGNGSSPAVEAKQVKEETAVPIPAVAAVSIEEEDAEDEHLKAIKTGELVVTFEDDPVLKAERVKKELSQKEEDLLEKTLDELSINDSIAAAPPVHALLEQTLNEFDLIERSLPAKPVAPSPPKPAKDEVKEPPIVVVPSAKFDHAPEKSPQGASREVSSIQVVRAEVAAPAPSAAKSFPGPKYTENPPSTMPSWLLPAIGIGALGAIVGGVLWYRSSKN